MAILKIFFWILDPFTGCTTTGIVANLADIRFLGIDMEEEFLKISINRKKNRKTASQFRQKLSGFYHQKVLELFLKSEYEQYSRELLF